MTQLIPLHSQTIDGNAVETVNARELHAFLEVQTRFNDWIKNRIEQYDFVENQDFLVVTEKKSNDDRRRSKVICSLMLPTFRICLKSKNIVKTLTQVFRP